MTTSLLLEFRLPIVQQTKIVQKTESLIFWVTFLYIVPCQRVGVSNKPTLGSRQRQDTGSGTRFLLRQGEPGTSQYEAFLFWRTNSVREVQISLRCFMKFPGRFLENGKFRALLKCWNCLVYSFYNFIFIFIFCKLPSLAFGFQINKIDVTSCSTGFHFGPLDPFSFATWFDVRPRGEPA